jgi:hypothetical protein
MCGEVLSGRVFTLAVTYNQYFIDTPLCVVHAYLGFGGNSSAVQSQLVDVSAISATSFAFAAIVKDGKVVTWGDAGTSSKLIYFI